MRIAAIDCGTNSLHLVIAQMDDEGRYDILHDLKEMPRLGEGVVQTGELSDVAMERALKTMEEFAHICARFGVQRTRAVTTSAVRRARNGVAFVEKVRERTGLPLQVISGEEEARLVAQAVTVEPGFTEGRFLIFNVGGGSTEFAWGRGRTTKELVTLPIGAVTLSEEYLKTDPPKGAEVRALLQGVKRILEAELPPGLGKGFTLYGTGGTVSTLAGIHQVLRYGVSFGSVFYPMPYSQTRELFLTLAEKDVHQRRDLPGLKSSRADIIVAGSAIVVGIMDYLGKKDMLTSGHGLKYGLLAEESRDAKHRLFLNLLDQDQVGKTRSPEVLHAIHVRELSCELFDATRPLHGYGDHERRVLGTAALLHDIGNSIERQRHHKHSYMLIRGANLGAMEGHPKELVAQVARYHRKARPRLKHAAFAMLSKEDRQRVRVLSALLRVADGFDRSHSQAISGVKVTLSAGLMRLEPRSERISSLDRMAAESHLPYLEEALGCQIELEAMDSDLME